MKSVWLERIDDTVNTIIVAGYHAFKPLLSHGDFVQDTSSSVQPVFYPFLLHE